MADRSEIDRILGEWSERRARGSVDGPDELLRQHPELADELRDALDVLELLEQDAPDTASDLPPGPEQIGDYRIVREIGRGGMGVVYEAEQVSMRRKVALKVLAPSITTTGRAVTRFQREAQAAGQLHHTNIVPVFGMGQEQGYWFYAMELVEGRALSDLIAELSRQTPRRRPSAGLDAFSSTRGSGERPARRDTPATTDDAYFRRVAEVFAGVAEALQVAHEQGVVHRDVKPSNLLLDADGELKIVDFGLAHLDEPGPSMTLTGDLVGTPAYMSPEQAMAKRVDVDHRTDIYSLGATLYEVLTLQPPFDGDTLQALCSQIITKDPALPRKLDEHIPKDLETVVLKAMEKDRDKRYPRAADFAADLQRFATGHMIRARRVGLTERAWRKVKRHRVVSSLVAALVVVGLVGGFFALRAADERSQREVLSYRALLVDTQREMPAIHQHGDQPDYCIEGVPKDDLLERLDEAIALRPDQPDAYWLRALTEGRPLADCRRDLQTARARGLDPQTTVLLDAYLDVRFRVGKPDLPGIRPANPLGWYAKARVVEAIGPARDAIPLLDRAVADAKPGELVYFFALRRRAHVHEACGELDRALADRELIAAMGYDTHALKLARADLLERLGRSDDAQRLYRQIVDSGDRSVRGNHYRSLALQHLAEPEPELRAALIADCEALLPEFEDDIAHTLWRLRAERREEQQDYDAALEALGRVFEHVQCVGCYQRRGDLLADHLRDFEAALADFDRCLELMPQAPAAAVASMQFRRGSVLEELGDLRQSLASLDEAVRLDPEIVRAHRRRGDVLRQLGRLDAAREAYEAALALDPEDALALCQLGVLFTDRLGDPERGLECFERALAGGDLQRNSPPRDGDFPIGSVLHENRGNALLKQGRVDEAVAAYESAREFGPQHPGTAINYAQALQDSGRGIQGQQVLRDTLIELRTQVDTRPEDGLLRAELAHCLALLGRLEEARAEFARAVADSGEEMLLREPDSLAAYASASLRDGHLQEALGTMSMLAEHDPRAEWECRRIELLAMLGKTDEAEHAARDAVVAYPDAPAAHYMHGLLIAKDRQEHFRRVLDLGWSHLRGLLEIVMWYAQLCDARPWSEDKDSYRDWYRASESILSQCGENATVRSWRRIFLCWQARSLFHQDDPGLDALALRKLEEAVELEPRYATMLGAMLAAAASRDDHPHWQIRAPKERLRLREHAFGWLRLFVSIARDGADEAPIEAADIATTLASIRMPLFQGGARTAASLDFTRVTSPTDRNDYFRGVRDADALAELPADERKRWRRLWDEVAEAERQARAIARRGFDRDAEIGEDQLLAELFEELAGVVWHENSRRYGVHHKLADRYLERGDAGRALRHSDLAARDAAHVHPGSRAGIERGRAAALLALDRPAEALAAVDRAHQLDAMPLADPADEVQAEAFRLRIRCLLALDRLDEAERRARERLEWLPDDADARTLLAEVLQAR